MYRRGTVTSWVEQFSSLKDDSSLAEITFFFDLFNRESASVSSGMIIMQCIWIKSISRVKIRSRINFDNVKVVDAVVAIGGKEVNGGGVVIYLFVLLSEWNATYARGRCTSSIYKIYGTKNKKQKTKTKIKKKNRERERRKKLKTKEKKVQNKLVEV